MNFISHLPHGCLMLWINSFVDTEACLISCTTSWLNKAAFDTHQMSKFCLPLQEFQHFFVLVNLIVGRRLCFQYIAWHSNNLDSSNELIKNILYTHTTTLFHKKSFRDLIIFIFFMYFIFLFISEYLFISFFYLCLYIYFYIFIFLFYIYIYFIFLCIQLFIHFLKGLFRQFIENNFP